MPGTDNVAIPPEFDNVVVPRIRVPAANVTVPAGMLLPARGLTVAVICVVPDSGILAGVTVAVVAVPTGGMEMVTVTEPVELVKFPEAA